MGLWGGAHGLSEWRGSAVRLYLLAAFDTTGASEAKCQTGKMTCGMQGDMRRRAVREGSEGEADGGE